MATLPQTKTAPMATRKIFTLPYLCKHIFKYQLEIDKLIDKHGKCLHLFPRLLVERLFNMCLVPYTLPVSERMKRLYQMYASLDENAIK